MLNKKKIDKNLGKLYTYKIDKIIEENEKKLRNILNKDNETFSKKMINIKDTFNKEFNSNIEKYNINLNIIPQSNSHEL
jgi:flagellin-specific chaperone FliS